MLDQNGVPVWYTQVANKGSSAFNVDAVVSGAISFVPSPAAKPYEIHHLAPLVTTYLAHLADEHELQVLPSGNVLTLGSALETGVDLTGYNVPLPDGGVEALGPNGFIHGCDIEETAPDGGVVWQWTGTDHLDSVVDCTYPQLIPSAPSPDGGAVADPFHCNSIDVDPANGNLLVSARDMDSIFYVDKLTGKILWKMGGSPYTKDKAVYVAMTDPFHRQHDARFQPSWVSTCSGGKGQISVFDDETDLPGPARGVVYDVDIALGDGGGTGDCGATGDGGSGTASVAWQYKGSISSGVLGSFRILADGSRIIGWGARSTDRTTFTEADVTGHDLLDVTLDPGQGTSSYRAIKVPLTGFNRSVLRSTAGKP